MRAMEVSFALERMGYKVIAEEEARRTPERNGFVAISARIRVEFSADGLLRVATLDLDKKGAVASVQRSTTRDEWSEIAADLDDLIAQETERARQHAAAKPACRCAAEKHPSAEELAGFTLARAKWVLPSAYGPAAEKGDLVLASPVCNGRRTYWSPVTRQMHNVREAALEPLRETAPAAPAVPAAMLEAA